MIFLLMTLVILVFAVLWNVDIHKILRLKSISQNAGDSAALVAARWQGITLNIIGDMNIMQAVAISEENSFALGAITNIQARLCYVGPMIALEASQQAAKNNGIYRNESFDERLLAHADSVRNEYPFQTDSSGEMMFPEPYEGCWEEYANMLESVALNGVAAGPDNAHFYTDHSGGHTLLDISFYGAVASQYWCWFFNNDYDLLKNYSNYHDWDPLPEIENQQYMNSEIFGLALKTEHTILASFSDDPDSFFTFLNTLASDRTLGQITTNAMETNALWFCYNDARWDKWAVMNTEAPDYFPLTGTLKEQYDYRGADAVCRISAPGLSLLTPHQDAPSMTWSAAAKPFGSLNDTELPNTYGIVLPAFHQVALIPVDASSAPAGGAYDIEWREHIEQHLDPYMSRGISGIESDCYYCYQLVTWENSSFRNLGISWLSTNSYLCTLPSGGGTHRGGGTSRGH